MRGTTITQYLIEQQCEYGNVPPELRLLIEVIARAVKRIGHSVTKGALDDLIGAAGAKRTPQERAVTGRRR